MVGRVNCRFNAERLILYSSDSRFFTKNVLIGP